MQGELCEPYGKPAGAPAPRCRLEYAGAARAAARAARVGVEIPGFDLVPVATDQRRATRVTVGAAATFVVNVTGSFALGFFFALALERIAIPVEARALIAIGFLGGYTTFSTLSFESIRLLESGEVVRASASLLGNLVIGLGAAYLGIFLARHLPL